MKAEEVRAKAISAPPVKPVSAKQLDELKKVLPKPYADYVPDFPVPRRRGNGR